MKLQIKMNEALFLRNPESSELGKNILTHSVQLIYKAGFEAFTFKNWLKTLGQRKQVFTDTLKTSISCWFI